MKIKRVISCLLVAVFSMSLLLVQESAQAKIGTVQKILPSELHVEGRYIYNAEGEKVRLTGANIPDLQWATGGDNDLMKRVGLLCDSWNANCVRLCVHSKFWFGQEWYQGKSYGDYRKMVDNVINQNILKIVLSAIIFVCSEIIVQFVMSIMLLQNSRRISGMMQ